MGAFGGVLSGINSGIDKSQKKGQSASVAPAAPAAKTPAATPSTPAVAAPPANPNGPVNTQTQQHGFHGLVPMVQGYYANHQAKVQDAQAQQHIQSLQDPHTTPEQRQYHISNLQHIYAGRPEVLKQMGIPVPSTYNVPQVQAPATAPATAPAAAPSSAGGK